jgi:poly(A) polymerase
MDVGKWWYYTEIFWISKSKQCEDLKIIKLFKGLIKKIKKDKPDSSNYPNPPLIISRAEHSISRSQINPNALKVLYRLHNAGYSAHLVGGCVRDILLQRTPKDFDIATSALPEEVRKLFRNCRLIGRRFRLAHIVFGKETIEVATYRTHHKDSHEQHGHSHEGMIIRDNVYGSIEDDAWRRDFTVNALYYNIGDFSILDYTGGMEDLNNKLLRMIGNPEQRFHEDPVRLLRAIRFASKLDLNISPETEEPILRLSHLLSHVSPARLFTEVLKFFQEGATLRTFKLLQKYHLFAQLFPQTEKMLSDPISFQLIEQALSNTDERLQGGKTVSPAFLFAIFLWRPVQQLAEKSQKENLPQSVAYEKALRIVLRDQTESLTIPRRLVISIQEICFLQYRMTLRYGSAPLRLVEHPRFRAGYDLLLLRSSAGEPVQELSDWWVKFYNGNTEQREALLKDLNQDAPKKKRRPRKRNNRHKKAAVAAKQNQA